MIDFDEKYTCKCCGGKIDRATMTCEYCGTQYKDNCGVMRFETFTNPVRTLVARAVVPRFEVGCIGPQETAQMAMERIQHELAKALTDVMKYDVELNPETNTYDFRGQVRAVIPKDNGYNSMFDVLGGR